MRVLEEACGGFVEDGEEEDGISYFGYCDDFVFEVRGSM